MNGNDPVFGALPGEYSVPAERSLPAEMSPPMEEFVRPPSPPRSRKAAKAAAATAIMSLRVLSVAVDPEISAGMEDTVRPIIETEVSAVSLRDGAWETGPDALVIKGDAGWLLTDAGTFRLSGITAGEEDGTYAFSWGKSEVDDTPGAYSSSVEFGDGAIAFSEDGGVTVTVPERLEARMATAETGREPVYIERYTGMSTADVMIDAGFWRPAETGLYDELATLSDGTGYVTVGDTRYPLSWEPVEGNDLEISILTEGWSLRNGRIIGEGSSHLVCILVFSPDAVHLYAELPGGAGYLDMTPKN